MSAVEIGTVEVLRLRIYGHPEGGDIAVEPGVYPLVSEPDGTIRWIMRGRRSVRRTGRFESLGDGLYAVSASGDEVIGEDDEQFPSKPFTRSQFREFVTTHPVCHEGGPEQRLRIRVLVEV